MNRSAVISDDGLYRYRLDRWWGNGPRALWVMFNPSTADADVDDATIRRVISFTRGFGYAGLTVANLWPIRARNPADLKAWVNRPGTDTAAARQANHTILQRLVIDAPLVIAAWGTWPGMMIEADKALWRTYGRDIHCLGTTGMGHPRHPLYLPAQARPVPWIEVPDAG